MLIELALVIAMIRPAPEIQRAYEVDHGYAAGVLLDYRLTNDTGTVQRVVIEASPDGKRWARYVYRVHPREIIECSPWIVCNSEIVTLNRPSVIYSKTNPKSLRVRVNGVEQLPFLVEPLRPEDVRTPDPEMCLTPT